MPSSIRAPSNTVTRPGWSPFAKATGDKARTSVAAMTTDTTSVRVRFMTDAILHLWPRTMRLTNLTNRTDDGSVVVMTLNLYEAKTQLSSLVDQAAAGEEIIIAKNGKPMAKLVPFKEKVKRKPGRLKGKIWMSKDFDAPMTNEELAAFEGSANDAELF